MGASNYTLALFDEIFGLITCKRCALDHSAKLGLLTSEGEVLGQIVKHISSLPWIVFAVVNLGEDVGSEEHMWVWWMCMKM